MKICERCGAEHPTIEVRLEREVMFNKTSRVECKVRLCVLCASHLVQEVGIVFRRYIEGRIK